MSVTEAFSSFKAYHEYYYPIESSPNSPGLG